MEYRTARATAIGAPTYAGNSEMLRARSGGTFFRWRSKATRTPSRDRNRVVESSSSNCTVAVPKVCGVASRTRAWFRMKVKTLEKSWRNTKEDIEVRDAASKLGLVDVDESAWWRERELSALSATGSTCTVIREAMCLCVQDRRRLLPKLAITQSRLSFLWAG